MMTKVNISILRTIADGSILYRRKDQTTSVIASSKITAVEAESKDCREIISIPQYIYNAEYISETLVPANMLYLRQ